MQISQLIEIYPVILLTDLLRYLIPASIAYLLFWKVFKSRLLHRFIQQKNRKSQQLQREFLYSMSTVFIFSLNGLAIHALASMGYTQIYTDFSRHGWTWFFISIILMMLIHDTYFYWAHRLMHHPKLYRHVHLVHHRSTSPSPWAAYAFHPFEAMIEAAVFWVFIFAFPVYPLALFTFLFYMITRNVLGHLGIELFPKWFLRSKWLNWHTTTTHHDLHHKNFNTNYGLYFSWWDKWMGTEDKSYQDTFEEVAGRAVKAPVKHIGKTAATTLVILLLFSTFIQAQSPAGLWQTFDEDTGFPLAQIEITETDQGLEGKIAKLHLQPWQGEDPVCTFCPGKRKDQKIIGMEFLWGFDTKGKNGKILDPVSGNIYACNMWVTEGKKLKVRGYTGPFNLFFRTQTWHLESPADHENPFTGIWKTIDDYTGEPGALVEIGLKEGQLSGKILRKYPQPYEGEEAICLSCPGNKKGQKIVGMAILRNLQSQGKKWGDGQILDPGNGRIYRGVVWLKDQNTLNVRAYLGPFFRTQTWKRVMDVEAGVKRGKIRPLR